MPSGFNGLMLLLVFLDYIRVSWLGKQQANGDARLPWVSLRISLYALLTCLVFLIGVVVLMLWLAKEPNANPLIAVLIFPSLVALLSVPLGLSYSLVRDYTRTHQALRTNLRVIEALSAQTLLQEQEKQLLLSQHNQTLERRVQQRTAELKHSLDELRMTQAQLIQREKLASLGELTAGIAHEIQNPLNFVTNFSEVSAELIQELVEENHKPQPDRAVVFELAGDLTLNLQKITQHGIRASSIVKGMLEHSRSSTGTIESTNLNALVDEYLHLAYQGQRAKDKAFDCELVTHFDPAIGRVFLMAQEIGRVLLNLVNNAYYAVKARKQQGEPDYQPTITVSTSKTRTGIEIRVSDNGTGMSADVQEKIFQPFFTTKPSGEGTGLGLSLSYDIVTKGHGGLLGVESQVGVGSVFTIQLPQLNSYA
jgi:signal transduction histidine kinase